MAARTRSVHFPLKLGAGDPALAEDRKTVQESRKHPILILGALGRDYLVIGDKLKTLHYDESAYHGNLQVILSAVRRMETGVKLLLQEAETD